MSVSEETLEMITEAIRTGNNQHGTLVRSKLTNQLLWKSSEHDKDDPFQQYLAMIGAGEQSGGAEQQPLPVAHSGRCMLGDVQIFNDEPGVGMQQQQQMKQHPPVIAREGGRCVLGNILAPNGQTTAVKSVLGEKNGLAKKPTGNSSHDKENWQDRWEMLKKAGQFCSFCKSNKEIREIYLSHNLKGPDGEIICPILKSCVCKSCNQEGHTIAHCPLNPSGTSILKMINRHNRI